MSDEENEISLHINIMFSRFFAQEEHSTFYNIVGNDLALFGTLNSGLKNTNF